MFSKQFVSALNSSTTLVNLLTTSRSPFYEGKDLPKRFSAAGMRHRINYALQSEARAKSTRH